jgi:MtN3 and saliva related transmembrane protein
MYFRAMTVADWIEAIGLFGAFLTSITFVPQVVKAWQTRSVGDLSLATMCIVLTSALVWLVYGLALGLRPVIIANSLIAVLSALLIYFKFTFPK